MSRLLVTHLMDGTMISTINRADDEFLLTMDAACDPEYGYENKPYESMVFLEERYPDEEVCVRYDTEEQARAGHAALVQEWKEKRGSEIDPENEDAEPKPKYLN